MTKSNYTMEPNQFSETNEQNREEYDGPDGTAPDSETQSSDASSRGERDTQHHLNPNDPAEGSREDS